MYQTLFCPCVWGWWSRTFAYCFIWSRLFLVRASLVLTQYSPLSKILTKGRQQLWIWFIWKHVRILGVHPITMLKISGCHNMSGYHRITMWECQNGWMQRHQDIMIPICQDIRTNQGWEVWGEFSRSSFSFSDLTVFRTQWNDSIMSLVFCIIKKQIISWNNHVKKLSSPAARKWGYQLPLQEICVLLGSL